MSNSESESEPDKSFDTDDVSIAKVSEWIRGLSDRHKGSILVLPSILYILIFFVAPVLIVLSYSIRVQESFSITNQFTAANFQYVFTTSTFFDALWFSFYISVIVTAISVVLGLPVAYYIAVRASPTVQNILIFLVVVPLLINFYVQAFAIIQITGSRGVLNMVLVDIGLISEPISWLIFSTPAVVMSLVYLWLPLMVLPIYAVLRNLDDELLLAARDLGAGPVRTHYEITIPSAFPGMILGSLFVFLFTFGDLVITRMIGGGRQVTYSQAIMNQLEGAANWAIASAATVVMVVVVLLLLVVMFRFIDMEEIF